MPTKSLNPPTARGRCESSIRRERAAGICKTGNPLPHSATGCSFCREAARYRPSVSATPCLGPPAPRSAPHERAARSRAPGVRPIAEATSAGAPPSWNAGETGRARGLPQRGAGADPLVGEPAARRQPRSAGEAAFELPHRRVRDVGQVVDGGPAVGEELDDPGLPGLEGGVHPGDGGREQEFAGLLGMGPAVGFEFVVGQRDRGADGDGARVEDGVDRGAVEAVAGRGSGDETELPPALPRAPGRRPWCPPSATGRAPTRTTAPTATSSTARGGSTHPRPRGGAGCPVLPLSTRWPSPHRCGEIRGPGRRAGRESGCPPRHRS